MPAEAPRVVLTRSEDDTARLGAELAAGLGAGDVVLLEGDLGAGKTAFVRGMAQGLGIGADAVSSPTFTLIQEYRGRVTLYHVDLYRLSAPEAEDLGLDELSATGILAVEWAEKLARPPHPAIRVSIDDLGDDQRRVVIAPAAAYSER